MVGRSFFTSRLPSEMPLKLVQRAVPTRFVTIARRYGLQPVMCEGQFGPDIDGAEIDLDARFFSGLPGFTALRPPPAHY